MLLKLTRHPRHIAKDEIAFEGEDPNMFGSEDIKLAGLAQSFSRLSKV